MEHIYADADHIATATTMSFGGNTFALTGITVYRGNRGRGYASRLLRRVLADADKEGVTLLLIVDPDGSIGCLDYAQLTSWYERYGFREDPESEIMVREPAGRSKSDQYKQELIHLSQLG